MTHLITRAEVERFVGDQEIDATAATAIARRFCHAMFIPGVKEDEVAWLIEAVFTLGYDIGRAEPATGSAGGQT